MIYCSRKPITIYFGFLIAIFAPLASLTRVVCRRRVCNLIWEGQVKVDQKAKGACFALSLSLSSGLSVRGDFASARESS